MGPQLDRVSFPQILRAKNVHPTRRFDFKHILFCHILSIKIMDIYACLRRLRTAKRKVTFLCDGADFVTFFMDLMAGGSLDIEQCTPWQIYSTCTASLHLQLISSRHALTASGKMLHIGVQVPWTHCQPQSVGFGSCCGASHMYDCSQTWRQGMLLLWVLLCRMSRFLEQRELSASNTLRH